MGSRSESPPYHQPHLSSLVVRPSGRDYEPGEVRGEQSPPYSRSDRYSDEPAVVMPKCKNVDLEEGYFVQVSVASPRYRARTRSVSVSPVRPREIDRRYSPELDDMDAPPRHRPLEAEREAHRPAGRYREFSGSHPRGRGGRWFGRGFEGRGGYGYGRGAFRGGPTMQRNTNVHPREGDWLCSHPMCGNLNFARREVCHKCKRPRYAPPSPRRGYGGPPGPMGHPGRFPGPPMDRYPGRFFHGYRSPPPRGWPRDFGPGGPPPSRYEGRFPDHHHHFYRDYPEEDFRDRGKFDRPPHSPRDHARDSFVDKKSYERRDLSPPPGSPPPSDRGRWADCDERERSRSPVRGPYMDRGRDERLGGGRGRIGNVY